MDAEKWKCLLTVVKYGSINKAAEKLDYTQSGLSCLIHSLEKECGLSLLERNWKGVRLTKAGEALLEDIHAFVDAEVRLQLHLDKLGAMQQQHIRIGTYPSISIHWLSKIIPEFQRDYPNIIVEIWTGSRDELITWMQNKNTDITFSDNLETPSTIWTELYSEPLLAVLPENHPCASNSVFNLDEVGDLPFLIPPNSTVGGNFMLNELTGHASLKVKTEDDFVLLSMVRQGIGFCIMPKLVLQDRSDGVAALPLSTPVYRHIGINQKEKQRQNKAVNRLILLVTNYVKTLKTD